MAKLCPISRSEFAQRAKQIELRGEYDGKLIVVLLEAKEFSTGSIGWGTSQSSSKVTLTLEGRDVPCQVGFNLTCIGSKELPKDAVPAAA